MSTLTSTQYVHQMGLECPSCRSDALSPKTPMESYAGIAWREVKCHACQGSWTESYGLVGYAGLTPRGVKLEHFPND